MQHRRNQQISFSSAMRQLPIGVAQSPTLCFVGAQQTSGLFALRLQYLGLDTRKKAS